MHSHILVLNNLYYIIIESYRKQNLIPLPSPLSLTSLLELHVTDKKASYSGLAIGTVRAKAR